MRGNTERMLPILPLPRSGKAGRQARSGALPATDSSTQHNITTTMIKEVTTARRGIQSVADATWPALEKVHGPIRKEFKIPLDRRLV